MRRRVQGKGRVAVSFSGGLDSPLLAMLALRYAEVVLCSAYATGSILGPAQARLDHGKAGLHEHDQEAGNQSPDKVDGDLILANLIRDVGNRHADLGVRRRDIIDSSCDRAPGIAFGQIRRRGRFSSDCLEFGVRRRRSCRRRCCRSSWGRSLSTELLRPTPGSAQKDRD